MLFALPSPDPDADKPLANEDLPEELWRSVTISLLGADAFRDGILFQAPAPHRIANWQHWVGGDFSRWIAPHLVAARGAAHHGADELMQADRAFDQAMDPRLRTRSLAAGEALLSRHDGARHLKPIQKLRRHIQEGGCPGHAASVFALQSALFNVTPAAVLVGYLYLEWRAAGGTPSRAAFERVTPQLARSLPNWMQSKGDCTFQPQPVE